MPFTSCVASKSIEVTKKYLGQGLNFQDTIVTTLDIFFNGTGTLSEWHSYINTYRATGTRAASLTVGGITFSNARITNFNAPSSPDSMNNAFRGTITVTIEEVVNGDLTNLTGELADIQTQLTSYAKIIENISESFSYTEQKGGKYDISHSVTVSLGDTTIVGGVPSTLALTIATAIGNAYRSGSTTSSIQDTLRNAGVVGYITTSENKITGEATFTRNINTLTNIASGSKTTNEYSHSTVMNKEGIINVTESGKIIVLNSSTTQNLTEAITALNTVLTDSVARCSTTYGLASTAFGGGGSLNSTALETTKNINKISQEVSYSVTYTDDPNQGTNFSTDRELTISQDQAGITELTEKANFTIYGSKGNLSQTPHSIYASESSGALGRLQSFFSSTGLSSTTVSNTFAKSTNVSYNPNGKNISYTKVFTTDRNRDTHADVKKQNLTVSDKPPVIMNEEFPIAGWKMVVHSPNKTGSATGGGKQTRLGERTVTLSCVLNRDTWNGTVSTPIKPTNAISYAAAEVENKLKSVFTDLNLQFKEIALTDCKYTVDSKRNLTVTATVTYSQAL
tara:strand:+ start:2880 stop:4580 length:1701 start_codon:yes stop_codon:yes gene_type:complete